MLLNCQEVPLNNSSETSAYPVSRMKIKYEWNTVKHLRMSEKYKVSGLMGLWLKYEYEMWRNSSINSGLSESQYFLPGYFQIII